MIKLRFWIEDRGHTIDDAYVHTFGDLLGDDLVSATEEFADYYHSNHDGWEDTWPIEFSVANELGKFLGKVSVERESEPVFSGRVVPSTQHTLTKEKK